VSVSGFATIIYEKRGPLAWITLNRPQVLNIYNVQMRDELYEVLQALKADDDVRVAVFKGAGEKAFCAGADLSEFLSAPPPTAARKVRWDRDVWGLFLSVPQPIIAALQGFVLGSGIEIALCCDIRLAAADVRFGLPEVALGIIPAAGGTQTLPRTIGAGPALHMLLANEWLDGERACAVGLVNAVVPREELYATAESLALRIAAAGGAAVRAAKQAVWRGLDMPLAEGLEMERRLAAGARAERAAASEA
jgi:enoyl-CoA hydratase/carnithine racemase